MKQALYPYQVTCCNKVYEEFEKGIKKTLLISATGTGKTSICSEIVDTFFSRGMRVLWLAHREELITQAQQRIYEFTGYLGEIDKAEKVADISASIILASVQTLRTKRLERYPKDHFDLVVVDEAHHASADSYKNILSYFDSKVLGVTATPDRADEKSLGDVFDSVAYQYSLI